MRIFKKLMKVFMIAFLIFTAGYWAWNQLDFHGVWLDEQRTISMGYEPIGLDPYGNTYQYRQYLDTDDNTISQILKDVEPMKKLYFIPEPRSGEQNYDIGYDGKQEIGYTLKSSGWMVVYNKQFPYQHSMWLLTEDDTQRIIEYIKNCN